MISRRFYGVIMTRFVERADRGQDNGAGLIEEARL